MRYYSYAFFDSPKVIDTGVTPIPKKTDPTLQVIADSGPVYGTGITFSDKTGLPIGVYAGDVGSEVLICIIGDGFAGQAWGNIPAHSRISLRAMGNDAITNGTLIGVLIAV